MPSSTCARRRTSGSCASRRARRTTRSRFPSRSSRRSTARMRPTACSPRTARHSTSGGSRMADVVFNEVQKVYENGFHAVHDLSLDIQDGEFLVLVGPSGCGKTTALRMVAGLEEISGGELLI